MNKLNIIGSLTLAALLGINPINAAETKKLNTGSLPTQIMPARDAQGGILSTYILSKSTRIHSVYEDDELLNFIKINEPPIQELANQFKQKYKTNEATAQGILDFIHTNIKYDYSELKSENNVRYPIETLFEKKGDCEDTAILGATLMKAAGLDVVLLLLKFPGRAHVAIGVKGDFSGIYYSHNGKKYFYAETTCAAPVGTIPENFGSEPMAFIYDVK